MTILHLSDTHGLHRQLGALPEADVIVHTGDFTFAGAASEVRDFVDWFCHLPYRHKVFIAGNHDDCLWGGKIEGLPKNCHYLCGSGITINGVRFWGVPMFMGDVVSEKYGAMLAAVPNDTEVLLTHQPPHGILDLSGKTHYGSPLVLQAVQRIKPKAHLFGHVHDQYGMENAHGTLFSNAAVVDDGYALKNLPRVITFNIPYRSENS